MEVGRIGIWSGPLRRGDREGAVRAAAAIEELGFRTAWMPGGEDDLGGHLRALYGATERLVLALGIVNIWFHAAAEIAELHAELTAAHPGRLLTGVGIGHGPLVNRVREGLYRRPFAAIRRYLDDLDAAPTPVPREERIVAAFGPQMLELAGERSLGAHPYLVTPEHTRMARATLGAGPLLATEQHVLLERDPVRARAIAREYLTTYWTLPNYINNFRRMGFSDADFAGGGSDRMVDALVAWGPLDVIIERVQQHFDAGADHVCLQALTAGRQGFPIADWTALAAAFGIRP